MINILFRRLFQATLVAWSIGTLTFILMRLLPGDFAFRIAAGRYGYDYVDAEAATAVRAELGLDRSGYELYLQWLWDLIQFDLGNSLISGAPVIEEVQHQLGHSLLLAVVALLISALIAIPIGVYCGKHADSMLDKWTLIVSVFIRAQPVFVIGLVLTIIFALHLGLLPVAGFGTPLHLLLPGLTLALSLAAMSNRLIRNATQSAINAPYFKFARLKGLSFEQAFQHHAQRHIAIPIVTFLALQTIGLMEGIIMIESLFSWPGIGHALAHAIFARDIPMIQATALVMGLLFVAINTVIDLVTYQLDPRQQQEVVQ
ncbi:ABC transporter permease [Vibrio tubiashii]|uniref:ABC transporter permease n=1 Tax=Vibrio tubiashii TaxID=29498 RepID=UPI001EFE8D2C|nr:ABC transporter permease [Vibrio tubiashii]MCG9581103.1 ABC transporter permease [Vibrio tubiashii]MCG9614694.1 ABC transporter permease [Vibrio tubiashii]MCG9686007.1 ABC transporter permease [Vibrio tubiashii]